jgi:hypothetical protein
LGPLKESDFRRRIDDQIKSFPNNSRKKAKTIANWRTEISALFSMVKTSEGRTEPTAIARQLAESEDLIEFFRIFLFKFQYPGGHVKPHEAAKMIRRGIRFLPAQFLIRVMQAGQQLIDDGATFGITPAEATHLVFNDLRVTASRELSPEDIAKQILKNRKDGTRYERGGDMVRYAKDILDYMEIADLVAHRIATDMYSLNPRSLATSITIAEKATAFNGYEHLYGSEPSARDVAACQLKWTEFASDISDVPDLAGDLSEVLALGNDGLPESINRDFLREITEVQKRGSSNEIGRIGEAIARQHERNRLRLVGRPDLARKVRKIPDGLGVGYDVKSYEGVRDGVVDIQRLIEVKTTRKRSRKPFLSFKMTSNEWVAAYEHSNHYFVYRILLSSGGPRMFVIRNPFQRYVDREINMIPRKGAEVTCSEKAGVWEELPHFRTRYLTSESNDTIAPSGKADHGLSCLRQ